MEHRYQVDYGRVELCPLLLEDAERMRILRNQNCQHFFHSAQITSEAQKQWYDMYTKAENDYMFSIILSSTNRWVGAVGLYHVDKDHKRGEFGRLLIDHSATSERGLGVDATLAACQFAFQQLGLSTVYLEVFRDNRAAVRTYKKAGFQLCGERAVDGETNILYMEKYLLER